MSDVGRTIRAFMARGEALQTALSNFMCSHPNVDQSDTPESEPIRTCPDCGEEVNL